MTSCNSVYGTCGLMILLGYLVTFGGGLVRKHLATTQNILETTQTRQKHTGTAVAIWHG